MQYAVARAVLRSGSERASFDLIRWCCDMFSKRFRHSSAVLFRSTTKRDDKHERTILFIAIITICLLGGNSWPSPENDFPLFPPIVDA